LVMFTFLATVMGALLLANLDQWRNRVWRAAALIAMLAIELLTFGRLLSPNLEPIASKNRLTTPAVVTALRDLQITPSERVDGLVGIGANYGTLFGVADIRGISPLRLAAIEALAGLPNQARLWEVLAVRYVLTPNTELSVPSSIKWRASSTQPDSLLLHELEAPRPFVRAIFKAWVEPDPALARGILTDPSFNAAETVILPTDPALTLPENPSASVQLISFAPEEITFTVQANSPAIYQIALPYYPGWQATINTTPTPILRADTAVSAVVVPAGQHTIRLQFAPTSYAVGVLISLGSLLLVLLFILAKIPNLSRPKAVKKNKG
jgi:Bacterial membrane protein YfhO